MWKNININMQNIIAETDKAVLINMPNNSDYKGYSFWHPSKLVRSGRHSHAVSLGYTDDFTFKLKKYGKGKYNKSQVVKEQEIDAEEFEIAFGVMNDNIKKPEPKYINEYETHKPEKVEAEEVEALDELKDH